MQAKDVVKKKRNELLSKKNVKGLGRGLDVDDDGNIVSDEEVIVVAVQKKMPLDKLDPADVVPIEVDGIKTRVRELGPIYALNNYPDGKDRQRPAHGGSSIGYQDYTTGTLGLAFELGGEYYILSNNHVMAHSNQSNPGDKIIQPGYQDGGKLFDGIAELDRFEKIKFRKNPFQPISGLFRKITNFFRNLFGLGSKKKKKPKQPEINLVDCALAKVPRISHVSDEIIDIGKVKGIREPELGMKVKKYGRTTGYTEGIIKQLNTTLEVEFSAGRKAIFEEQIVTSGMSSTGDSGSVLLDQDNYLVGLIFSGNEKYTVANEIKHVFESLEINPKF